MRLRTLTTRRRGRPAPAATTERSRSCSNDDTCCFSGEPAVAACTSPGVCGCKAGSHPADLVAHCR